MKFVEVQQNSDQWKELRRSNIGASDCPVIMGKHPYKNLRELWDEKIKGIEPFISPAMRRGTSLEPVARKWLEEMRGESFSPCVAQHPKIPFMIASLDGLSKDFVLEIKCPLESRLEKAKNGELEEYWLYQIQHQLAVTGYPEALLLVFDEVFPQSSAIHTIPRDDKLIAEIIEKEKNFFHCMANFIEPDFAEGKLEVRMDPEYLEAETSYLEASAIVESAKNALEQALELQKISRDSLIHLSGDRPTKGLKTVLKSISQPGRINFSKLPQDLKKAVEPYRGESYKYWKVDILTS